MRSTEDPANGSELFNDCTDAREILRDQSLSGWHQI